MEKGFIAAWGRGRSTPQYRDRR